MKILRMFIIAFIVAAFLNVANFFVCYYIHVRNELLNEEVGIDIEEPTTTMWEDDMSTLLICGENATDCPNRFTERIEAMNINETTEKFNGFYYYIQDAVLSNTRVCPNVPPGLGPVETDVSLLELNAFDEMFSYIKPGGWFRPRQCIPRQSMAIIIPMLDGNSYWKTYFGTFLFYIHLFLMKQLQEYQIFVIIQVGDRRAPFTRGKLLNIGYVESQKMRRNGWDCLVFHDAYYIPTDTRNLYRCTRQPRRLVSIRNAEDMQKFGGVVAIRPSIFKKVNGFSNLNWYNDGDYINMFQRLNDWNYTIETIPSSIGKYYTTLDQYPHVNFSRRSRASDMHHATTPIHLIDGLSSLGYRIVNAGFRRLFTFIEVDLDNEE